MNLYTTQEQPPLESACAKLHDVQMIITKCVPLGHRGCFLPCFLGSHVVVGPKKAEHVQEQCSTTMASTTQQSTTNYTFSRTKQ